MKEHVALASVWRQERGSYHSHHVSILQIFQLAVIYFELVAKDFVDAQSNKKRRPPEQGADSTGKDSFPHIDSLSCSDKKE
jgi:hypothetical protein